MYFETFKDIALNDKPVDAWIPNAKPSQWYKGDVQDMGGNPKVSPIYNCWTRVSTLDMVSYMDKRDKLFQLPPHAYDFHNICGNPKCINPMHWLFLGNNHTPVVANARYALASFSGHKLMSIEDIICYLCMEETNSAVLALSNMYTKRCGDKLRGKVKKALLDMCNSGISE